MGAEEKEPIAENTLEIPCFIPFLKDRDRDFLMVKLRTPYDKFVVWVPISDILLRCQKIGWKEKLQNLNKQGEAIRMILKKGLKKKDKLISSGNDLWKLAKLKIKGGPKDLSEKLDYYLYGAGRQNFS